MAWILNILANLLVPAYLEFISKSGELILLLDLKGEAGDEPTESDLMRSGDEGVSRFFLITALFGVLFFWKNIFQDQQLSDKNFEKERSKSYSTLQVRINIIKQSQLRSF